MTGMLTTCFGSQLKEIDDAIKAGEWSSDGETFYSLPVQEAEYADYQIEMVLGHYAAEPGFTSTTYVRTTALRDFLPIEAEVIVFIDSDLDYHYDPDETIISYEDYPMQIDLLIWHTVELDPAIFYWSIQDAINAASASETIFVYNGVYNEGLLVDRAVTIIGLCDVTLDGAGIDVNYGIHITANDVTVKNFLIVNFTYGWGWGVQLTGADYCLLENLRIEKCNSGINLYRGSDYNTIQYCEVNGIGGHGISIYGSDLGCTHNTIRNNKMMGCAWYMPYGIIHLPVMPVFSGASYNIIEGNIINGTGVGYGIGLWGYTYGRADMPETGNLIKANTI